MSESKQVIFLFHRDLRLEDHRPLQYALDLAKKLNTTVIPLFIFTPEQVSKSAPIRSLNSVACLLESLEELDKALPHGLNIGYGDTVKVLKGINESAKIAAIVETKDYTPYAKQREAHIQEFCKDNDIEFTAIDDLYLLQPGTVRTGTNKIYQKFTPFYELAKRKDIPKPLSSAKGPFAKSSPRFGLKTTLEDMRKKIFTSAQTIEAVANRRYKGGREEGLKLLKSIPKNYEDIHDILAEETSGLSVHHHNGTISIRESYWQAEKMIKQGHKQLEAFQRQLFWRDFYGHLMAYFEELYKVDAFSFQKNLPKPLSEKKKKIFKDWCEGKTGYDLVDAGMNQLNETGFMHNRVRLVCASWLVKDMGIHWRLGERYFAEKLSDYDFTQNMMNWIWVASVLPFASAPFRRHDPDRIQERLDPDNKYVDKWL